MKKCSDTLRGWAEAGMDLRIGLDVSDKRSHWAAVDLVTGERRSGEVETTPAGIEECFGGVQRCTVLQEAGMHSHWLAQKLRDLGHRAEVVPSDALRVGSGKHRRRNDQRDANGLMELAIDVDRARVKKLWQRPREYQEDLALMRLRDATVRARALLVNAVRGSVKQFGERIERCDIEVLPRRARAQLSERILALVEPLLAQIEELTRTVKAYDSQVETYLARRPEANRLLAIPGVGPVTVGVFMAVVAEPKRFRKSRDVPAYLGLVPGEDQSGEENPQKRITKAGDPLARRVLLQCAHYILSNRGTDCAMRRWALALAGEGRNRARRKKAAVALARRLAVTLHRLWVSGEKYDPMRGAKIQDGQEANA